MFACTVFYVFIVFSPFLGDSASPVTPSVTSKSKSRKETLAALAAAQKNKKSASSRKRKERNRSTQAKRTGGKEWRKTVNEMEPDDNTANENERSVASDSVIYVIFNCSMNLSGEFEVGAWNFQSGSWDPHIWPNKGP